MLEPFRSGVAVVTGAGDGIGRALALELASCGLSVAVLDIRRDAAEDVAGEIEQLGVPAAAYACDVAERDQVEAVRDCIARDLGEPRLVWANAGVGAPGAITEMEPSQVDWLYAVNIGGTYNTLRAFVPGLKALEGPRLVGLTASVSGITNIGAWAAVYGATKYAMVGIGEGLIAELEGTGIGVTIACPGLVNTRIWDAGRARQDRFGGVRRVPESVGERWRAQGMDVGWVARTILEGAEAGMAYVSPVDPHSALDFSRRAETIQSSFRFDPRASASAA